MSSTVPTTSFVDLSEDKLKALMQEMEDEAQKLGVRKKECQDEMASLDTAIERYNVAIEAIANLLCPNDPVRVAARAKSTWNTPNKQRIRNAILQALRKNGKPMRLHDLWEALHATHVRLTKPHVDKVVTVMHQKGEVTRPGRGLYDINHEAEKAKKRKTSKALFDADATVNLWDEADKIMVIGASKTWTTMTLQEALIKKLGRKRGFVHTRKIGNYFRRRLKAGKVTKHNKGSYTQYKWRAKK